MPPDRVVVGFAGAMGAGKTLGAKYLQDHFGFRYLRYSQILADWYGNPCATKAELQNFGWLVMHDRQEELNQRLIAQIGDCDYAIDGLRCQVDHDYLRRQFSSRFFLLYVDASTDVRKGRLLRNGRHKDEAEFLAADNQSVERFVRGLASTAFAVIVNEQSVDQYYTNLREVLQRAFTYR